MDEIDTKYSHCLRIDQTLWIWLCAVAAVSRPEAAASRARRPVGARETLAQRAFARPRRSNASTRDPRARERRIRAHEAYLCQRARRL